MEIINEAQIDYLPRAKPQRRRPVIDEFDRECGYSYDHVWVFVTFMTFGDREYECANCGDRATMSAYTCDADIHEMVEVGAMELAFAPAPFKTRDTIEALRKDAKMLRSYNDRRWADNRKHKGEVDLDEL